LVGKKIIPYKLNTMGAWGGEKVPSATQIKKKRGRGFRKKNARFVGQNVVESTTGRKISLTRRGRKDTVEEQKDKAKIFIRKR